ncbi:MAG TPA: hypothetical protein VFP37_02335 [Steroidobacteraceae bacterium]|nr:hypothetical protein [Steroidobacteraceae bacterium]
MNYTKPSSRLSIFAAALLLGAASQASHSHGRQLDDCPGSGDLVGVWNITSQPVDCVSGQPLPAPPIVGMIAFHEGGTSTEAAPSATPRTPGLGTWFRTGQRSFTATAHVMNYDVSGISTGSLIVRREITVAKGGGKFTAKGRTTIVDASGNKIERCTSNEGVRADD